MEISQFRPGGAPALALRRTICSIHTMPTMHDTVGGAANEPRPPSLSLLCGAFCTLRPKRGLPGLTCSNEPQKGFMRTSPVCQRASRRNRRSTWSGTSFVTSCARSNWQRNQGLDEHRVSPQYIDQPLRLDGDDLCAGKTNFREKRVGEHM